MLRQVLMSVVEQEHPVGFFHSSPLSFPLKLKKKKVYTYPFALLISRLYFNA